MALTGIFTNTPCELLNYQQSVSASVRTLQSRLAETYSIEDFGASSDASDNSSAIQAAITYAESRPSYGSGIIIPNKVYRYTTPLRISKSSIILLAAHSIGMTSFSPLNWAGACLYYTANDGQPAISIYSDDLTTLYDIEFNNFRIAASTSGGDKSTGIYIKNGSEFKFNNIYIGGSYIGTGYHLDETDIIDFENPYITDTDIGIRMTTYGGSPDDKSGFNINRTIKIRGMANFWQNKVNVKIEGNADVIFYGGWYERFGNCIEVPNMPDKNVNVSLEFHSPNMTTDSYYSETYPNPCIVKVTCENTADYFTVSDKMFFKNCNFSTPGDYCIQYVKNGNTNSSTLLKTSIEGGIFKAATSIIDDGDIASGSNITGIIYAKTQGGVTLTNLTTGGSKWNKMRSIYGMWDMANGYPIFLPQNNLANYTDGQLFYSTTAHRAKITDGSAANIIPIILTGSATIDFEEIAAGAIGTGTITVTGAATGDSVSIGVPSGIDAGLIVFGYVSATNTVTLRVYNSTAGAINPASATWKASVVK